MAFHHNISNTYIALGNTERAMQHLQQALRINPHHADSYNNLGRLYFKLGLFLEAIPYFEKAIRLHQNFWEAHYNLAHSFSHIHLFDRAMIHYEETLNIQANHQNAAINLGLLHFEKHNFEQTIQYLEKALSLEQETDSTADTISILRYLGEAYVALGNIPRAIEIYHQGLSITDHLSDFHHNLAILYLREGQKALALQHFEKSLEIDPSNETASHMSKALKGEQDQHHIPPNYVTDLFDQYADYYNRHMKEKLKYDVPGLLRNAFGRCLKTYRTGRLLDLGCGTGLCGIYFRDLSLELIGIDLSCKMLEKAKALDTYDQLIQMDIVEYLLQKEVISFDYIIAGDVLGYFGALEPLFEAIASKVATKGYFGFTIESIDSIESIATKNPLSIKTETEAEFLQDFQLTPSGRFAHHPRYIEKLCTMYKFDIQLMEEIVPRWQEDNPIEGHLFVLTKQ